MQGYDQDFFLWTQETARAISEGRFEEIDRAALADEVESLGRRDRRAIGSRLEVVLLQLLKTKYQPERLTRCGKSTIITQRAKLQQLLEESPSLRAQLPSLLADAYRISRERAAAEAGLDTSTFPATCEWTIEEALNG